MTDPLYQGFPNVFVRGPHSYYTTVRGPDILPNVIVSGYVTFYNSKNFRKYVIFSLLTEIASRARFGPRVVVWKPLHHINDKRFPKEYILSENGVVKFGSNCTLN